MIVCLREVDEDMLDKALVSIPNYPVDSLTREIQVATRFAVEKS